MMAALVAVLSLGACYWGPDPVQYAALAVVDGRPAAVVAACGRPQIDVTVFLDGDQPDHALHLWSVTLTLPNPVDQVEVGLLAAPQPGWKVSPGTEPDPGATPGGIPIVALTSIEPGRHYTLDSSTSGPEGSRAPAVTFTTDDLPRIGQGQVLAATGRDRPTVISRESFVHQRCG